jgi:hypothetical protein
MGWSYDEEATRRLLTEFGYGESDLPQAGRIIEI